MDGATVYSSTVSSNVDTSGDTLNFDIPVFSGDAAAGFNIFDCANDAFMYLGLVNGGAPLSQTGVNIRWAPGNNQGTWYENNVIQLLGIAIPILSLGLCGICALFG